MNYNQIFDEVKLLSKRGDIDDKIATAIRLTTLRAHRLDYFWRDLVETQLGWAASGDQTLVDLNIPTLLPRFRAANYVRYWNPSDGTLGNMLTKLDPRDVLDDYNYEKLDRYYTAGDLFKIKFEYPSSGVQIGYYCDPLLYPPTSYSSWITDKMPDLIIQGALAYLYNQSGKQEEARSLNAMVGFETNPGNNMAKGPTLVEQFKAFALEEDAR